MHFCYAKPNFVVAAVLETEARQLQRGINHTPCVRRLCKLNSFNCILFNCKLEYYMYVCMYLQRTSNTNNNNEIFRLALRDTRSQKTNKTSQKKAPKISISLARACSIAKGRHYTQTHILTHSQRHTQRHTLAKYLTDSALHTSVPIPRISHSTLLPRQQQQQQR